MNSITIALENISGIRNFSISTPLYYKGGHGNLADKKTVLYSQPLKNGIERVRVNILETSGHLDYLSETFPFGTSPEAFTDLCGAWEVSGVGPRGYERRLTSENGALLYDHGPIRMGVHLVLKGQQLEAIREKPLLEITLVEGLALMGGRPSRVDLCVNLLRSELTVDDLWQQWSKKEVKTRAKKARRYTTLEGEGNEDGFYIGTRGSAKYLRVYNKGLQLGLNEAHVRLELECHKLKARAMIGAIQEAGQVRTVANRAILDHAAFYDPRYLEALSDNNVEIPKVTRPDPAFWRWIERQVLPAVARYQTDHPDERVLDRIEQRLTERLTIPA